MGLPFTIERFLRVFSDFNAAIWPAQIAALALGALALGALALPREAGVRLAFAAMALLWAFTGIGYHLMFFARINPVAPVFAGLFVLQAILFLASAVRPDNLHLKPGRDFRSVAGVAVIVWTVAVYPILGIIAGHGLMAGPMFGVAPCPTTMFTLGFLLIARGHWVVWLSVIPVLWSVVGLGAAVQLGIREDLGLPVAGAVLVWALAAEALRDRAARRAAGGAWHPTR